MRNIQTELLANDDAGTARAGDILRAGGLVALPTETVYGLAADATNATAVAEIFAAKDRPQFNPLIVHCTDIAMAMDIGVFDDHAQALANAFWPGPLTLVVPVREGRVARMVTAGLPSVALRVPGHPTAQAVIAAANTPLAAPSANPSGRISPTTARHVMDGLAGRIDAVLDGGACDVGLESTILDVGPAPKLLRPGGLAAEMIEAHLEHPLLRAAEAATRPTAPGQLASHYAPAAAVRLNATVVQEGEQLLGFGGTPGATLDLSPTGDLTEAAARLFDALHQLDHNSGTIAVAPIPETGLGRAINDRLRRAAAPRP